MTEPATRAHALHRLDAFRPRMGRHYADRRNYDPGPGRRDGVSGLSPWIARRLLLEEEAVAAALDTHGPRASEKFVAEVVWRTYFKGWLEHRPQVWHDYRSGVACDRAAWADTPSWTAAEAGNTGIAPFDAWARELVATGDLHNHARMWFASIWIFTLGLPWRLGADFFLRHLRDGDAASNTCSWRWVAGLHTVGKTYAARSSNIAKYTEGRFGGIHGLAAEALPLDEGGLPAPQPPRAPRPLRDVPSLRLITTDDCCPEMLPQVRTVATATLQLTDRRSAGAVSAGVAAFDAAALADAGARAGGAVALHHPTPADLVALARAHGAAQIVTAFVPVGWVGDWIDTAEPVLAAAGIGLGEQRRDWDTAFHPHTRGGFFGVKKQIPRVLAELGLGPGALPLFGVAAR